MLVAWHASWRFALLVGGVLVIPFALMGFIFEALAGAGGPLMVAPLLLAVSILAHEYGHVAASRLVSPRGQVEANGGWLRASVVRPAVDGRRDALISSAGPLLGIGVGAIALLIPTPIPLVSISAFLLVFLYHAWSLTPFSADGRLIIEALHRR